MNLRILTKLSLIFSILFLPFWVTFFVFISSVIYFKNFYFGLIVIFIYELVYDFENFEVFKIKGAVFVLSVAIFFAIEKLKTFFVEN